MFQFLGSAVLFKITSASVSFSGSSLYLVISTVTAGARQINELCIPYFLE